MSKKVPLLESLELKGLHMAAPQCWGAIRLIPLIREQINEDFRICRQSFDADATLVTLKGELLKPDQLYTSYIPHGLVMSWEKEGGAEASYGTQLIKKEGKTFTGPFSKVQVLHRMVRREKPNRLRLLPLHLAMEGFLSLFFKGPMIAWSEYARDALTYGLSPRIEQFISGRSVPGMKDALRIFEIHKNQTGVLLFVGESLFSVFLVSHPDDYRQLHSTLIEDFYAEYMYYYGLYGKAYDEHFSIDAGSVHTLEDLESSLKQLKARWSEYNSLLIENLKKCTLQSEKVNRIGPFHLQRFNTGFELSQENHIGEAIVRDDLTLEYLKTYRLSPQQTKRAYLLSQLAHNNWNLDATAQALKQSKEDLILRLEKAGFGYLLKDHVIKEARRKKRF